MLGFDTRPCSFKGIALQPIKEQQVHAMATDQPIFLCILLYMSTGILKNQVQSSATHLQGIFPRLLPTHSEAILEGRSDEHNHEDVDMHIDDTFYLKQLISIHKSV